jgi:molecular chaperone GrpE
MVDETPTQSNPPEGGGLAEAGALPVEVENEELTKLREKVEALEKEKKETYDRLLRAAADLDNFRKRQRKETEEARIKAREDALREILPGIDNLERALAAAGKESGGGGIVEGVKLVLRQFLTALERQEVKAFESVGQPFDPTRHEAISQVESDAHPPGAIALEMQRGYTIGNRLLRPALVAVARPKAPPAPPEEAGAAPPEEGGEEKTET